MMSTTELEQLDAWMFAQGIRSRGEAIRNLVGLGLEATKVRSQADVQFETIIKSDRRVTLNLKRVATGKPAPLPTLSLDDARAMMACLAAIVDAGEGFERPDQLLQFDSALRLPSADVTLTFRPQRGAHTSNFTLSGADAEQLLLRLRELNL